MFYENNIFYIIKNKNKNKKQFLIIKYIFYIFCCDEHKTLLKNNFQTKLNFLKTNKLY